MTRTFPRLLVSQTSTPQLVLATPTTITTTLFSLLTFLRARYLQQPFTNNILTHLCSFQPLTSNNYHSNNNYSINSRTRTLKAICY